MNAYRLFSGRAVAGLLIVLQAACDMSTGPVSLTMSIDPTTITLGQSATITWEWNTPEGGFCHASGAWHGDKKANNSNVVTPTETGTLTYTLECFEDIDATHHRSRTASVTLTVNPAAATQTSAARAMAAEYAFTTIDYPGADRTEAYGINNAGQIVGYFFDAAGRHAFMKDGDDFLAIDGLEASFIEATRINDRGDVAGNYVGSTGQLQAFKMSEGLMAVIQVPGASAIEAHGINQLGQVVGTFIDANDVAHGFVMSDAGISNLDAPGAASPNFTQARGINDAGSVVGWFDEGGGVVRAFLATPVNMISAAIDVLATDRENTVDPRSTVAIWIGILSNPDPGHTFDAASQVDTATVTFGPARASATRYEVRDIDNDGLDDLALQFRASDAGFRCGDTRATLTGATFDGHRFTGADRIAIVGCR